MFELIKKLASHTLVQTILVSIVTTLGTCFIANRKIRTEQKANYKSSLGERITTAYLEVKSFLEECIVYEIYDIDNGIIKREGNDITDEPAVYPSFMNDKDSMREFVSKLSNTRKNCEAYVDLKTAAGLLMFEKYIVSLLSFINENDISEDLRFVGGIVYIDIVKWQRDMDEQVIKMLNKPKYKIYSKNGKRWEKIRENAVNKYLKQTALNEMNVKGIKEFLSPYLPKE